MVNSLVRSRAFGRWSAATAAGLLAVAVVVPAVGQTRGSGGASAAGPSGSTSGPAGEEQRLRDRVVYLLSGYHFSASREQLDELAEPARVAETLRAIASDASIRPSLRGRAVDVLALYHDPETVAFLEQLLAPPQEDVSEDQRRIARDLRHRAILSYAKNRSAKKVVARLGPLLEIGDRQLQLTVVAALGNYTGEAGAERLAAFAQTGEDDILTEAIAEYIDHVPNSED